MAAINQVAAAAATAAAVAAAAANGIAVAVPIIDPRRAEGSSGGVQARLLCALLQNNVGANLQ